MKVGDKVKFTEKALTYAYCKGFTEIYAIKEFSYLKDHVRLSGLVPWNWYSCNHLEVVEDVSE